MSGPRSADPGPAAGEDAGRGTGPRNGGPSPLRRGAVVVLFLALLAAPFVLRGGGGEASALDPAEAVERFGVHYEEVAGEAGIDFVHEAPRLDPRLDHVLPEVASLGASVAVADFDRDGFDDLYVTNSAVGSANALYRNRGDGTFEDVAADLGVARLNGRGTGVSTGAVWGDYDDDGFEDLLVYRWGDLELFHNDEGEGFTPVGDAAGLTGRMNAATAVWLDYDRDGRLDLFVGGFYPDSLDLWELPHTRMMPESFEYAENGGRDRLYRNLGNGRFEDVAGEVGLGSPRWTLAAVAVDLQEDGWPDLVVANDFGVDEVWINREGRAFVEAGEATGIGFAPKSGMNASVGDVFNRGDFAIYVSNISEEGILLQGNNLWVRREGAGPGDPPRYENVAGVAGVERAGWSYGARFGDLNNDGWQDLFVVNGFVSGEPGTSYWYDFSNVALGNRRIIEDAGNWPDMAGRSLAGHQHSRVWLNDGAGRFDEVGLPVGVEDVHDGRGVALVDLWNRGALDVVVSNQRGPLLLYRATVDPANAWIAFELEGVESNRSAIGAELRLHWNGGVQAQQVDGGSGFGSQGSRRLHFGLGPDPRVEKAVIRWPSGAERVVPSPEPGRVHRVREAP